MRTEATGYGAVYFMQNMLANKGDGLEGKKVVVSGSGNVATFCIEKCNQLGAKVLACSDSGGSIHDPDEIDDEKLAFIKDLKQVRRGRISEYTEKFPNAEFRAGKRPWDVPCDLAFPCATQNELDGDDAKTLIANGCEAVAEGANMPSTLDAAHHFLDAKCLFGPAKAANAGGGAVSGLEQAQNSMRIAWSHEEVEGRLADIMKGIHDQCIQHGQESDDFVNYVKGANIAGFVKVADAMLAYGVV